jgi:hypothetical protein
MGPYVSTCQVNYPEARPWERVDGAGDFLQGKAELPLLMDQAFFQCAEFVKSWHILHPRVKQAKGTEPSHVPCGQGQGRGTRFQTFQGSISAPCACLTRDADEARHPFCSTRTPISTCTSDRRKRASDPAHPPRPASGFVGLLGWIPNALITRIVCAPHRRPHRRMLFAQGKRTVSGPFRNLFFFRCHGLHQGGPTRSRAACHGR